MSGADRHKDLSKEQRALRADTAERLEAILEAAERAAAGVIDDAEAQARQYLAQARAEADRLAEDRDSELSGLIDSLLAQASSLRQEAERLQATLEAVRSRTGAEDEPTPASLPDPQPGSQGRYEVPRLRAVDGVEPSAPAADPSHPDPAGARLLATQMAVSGSSREEIAQRLRSGFEIEDADAILDAILGPED